MKKTLLLGSLLLTIGTGYSQTTLSLQPNGTNGKDAEIGLIVPDTNYGTSEKLSPYAWTQGGSLNVTRGFLEFDLTSIPANATITSAKLSLYFNPYYPAVPQHNGNNSMWIRRVLTAWDENTITWNNQPNTTLTSEINVPQSTTNNQNYPDIDVTILVQEMLAISGNNHGFMIRLQDESPYSNSMLASSDNQDATIRPKLEVTFTTSTATLVENNNVFNSVKVYPNPFISTDEISVDLGEKFSFIKATITNSLGQVVAKGSFASTDLIKMQIDGPKGLYFLCLETEKGEKETIELLKH